MQSRDTKYLLLDDGRKLCLECLDSAIMDTHECQPLYLEIQEFYEGLNMKIEQQIPMLLVERQALNEAMEGEKNVNVNCVKLSFIECAFDYSYFYHPFFYCPDFGLFFLLFTIECRVITTYLKLEDFVCQKSKLSPL